MAVEASDIFLRRNNGQKFVWVHVYDPRELRVCWYVHDSDQVLG